MIESFDRGLEVFHVNNGYLNTKPSPLPPTQGERQRAECACAAEDLGPVENRESTLQLWSAATMARKRAFFFPGHL